jgi:2-C-methyl-D-erythritol 4-phosphate cytidylyltransferase
LVVVVPPGEVDRARSILKPVPRAWKLAVGGQRRQDSAWAGLEAAGGSWVLLHDVARPLVSPDLIRRVLRAAKAHGAAVPVLPAVDTMRYLDGEFLAPKTLDRAGLVRVQTPQGFSRDLLLLAYQRAREQGRDLPDDAAALLALGKRVAAVPGEPANLKLTYPEDRKLLLALVKNLYRH